MGKTARVLISNIGLPTAEIGSWTTRISHLLIQHPKLLNYILSPNTSSQASIFCKKRSFITWKKQLRKVQLKKWGAL